MKRYLRTKTRMKKYYAFMKYQKRIFKIFNWVITEKRLGYILKGARGIK